MFFFLDCTSPFTVQFITNTAGIAEAITTIAQRGKININFLNFLKIIQKLLNLHFRILS